MEASVCLWALGFLSTVWEVGGGRVSLDVVGGWPILSDGVFAWDGVLEVVALELLKLATKLGFLWGCCFFLVVKFRKEHVAESPSGESVSLRMDTNSPTHQSCTPGRTALSVAGILMEASLDELCSDDDDDSSFVGSTPDELDYPDILSNAEEFFAECACRIHGANKSRVCAKEMSINWFEDCGRCIALKPHFEASINQPHTERVIEKTSTTAKVGRLAVVLGLEGTLVKTWKEGSSVTMPYDDVPPPHKANIRNLRIEPFRVKGCVGIVRPGVREFLQKVAAFADIYVYTLSFNRNVARRIMEVLTNGRHQLFKGLETRSVDEKGMKDLMVFECNMERTVLVDHRRSVKQSSHLISVYEFKGNPLDGYLMDQVFPIIQAVNSLERAYVEGGRHYSEELEAAYSHSLSKTSENTVEKQQE